MHTLIIIIIIFCLLALGFFRILALRSNKALKLSKLLHQNNKIIHCQKNLKTEDFIVATLLNNLKLYAISDTYLSCVNIDIFLKYKVDCLLIEDILFKEKDDRLVITKKDGSLTRIIYFLDKEKLDTWAGFLSTKIKKEPSVNIYTNGDNNNSFINSSNIKL